MKKTGEVGFRPYWMIWEFCGIGLPVLSQTSETQQDTMLVFSETVVTVVTVVTSPAKPDHLGTIVYR